MFQLVMSHIHDSAESERFDSDSSVGNIEDGLVALQAFQAYVARLSADYGITFTLGEHEEPNSPVVIRAWAPMPNSAHGSSTVYVELQQSRVQDDVEHIMALMLSKARYTQLVHPI